VVIYALDRIIPHIYNFPEGMAIAIGSVTEVNVSFFIALAIAIDNIPEGICTSAPYYLASGSRLKSFLLSSTGRSFASWEASFWSFFWAWSDRKSGVLR
jgi:zinc transporter ZupT